MVRESAGNILKKIKGNPAGQFFLRNQKKIFLYFFIMLHIYLIYKLGKAFLAGSHLAVLIIIPLALNLCLKCPWRTTTTALLVILAFLFFKNPGDIGFKRTQAGFRYRVIPIVYGYPSEQLMQQAREKKVILGGCDLVLLAPHWRIVIFY